MCGRKVVALLVLLSIAGCSTVTIKPEGSNKLSSQPTYEESKSFYFFGLSGEHRIDVAKVCGDKKVAQMQTQQTFVDGLLGVVTLGIYAPHSVKIWCS
jgi:hypothetical protein